MCLQRCILSFPRLVLITAGFDSRGTVPSYFHSIASCLSIVPVASIPLLSHIFQIALLSHLLFADPSQSAPKARVHKFN